MSMLDETCTGTATQTILEGEEREEGGKEGRKEEEEEEREMRGEGRGSIRREGIKRKP